MARKHKRQTYKGDLLYYPSARASWGREQEGHDVSSLYQKAASSRRTAKGKDAGLTRGATGVPDRVIMRPKFCLMAILFLASTAAAQTPPAPLVSPEVHSDKSVTFRFRGPNDKEVAVSMEGSAKPLPMRKDDQGVWSVTTEPLAPDYYGYSIVADGVGMFDPSN